MRSDDEKMVSCLTCQVREYANTEILVGLHGAGLTNIMFMPPDAIIVEIVGQFDGRMLPVCGYHGPLAATFGVHHYIHYYDFKGNQTLDFELVAKEVLEFQKNIHI
jgi:capsular polysaccharide biosynthesis protein